MKQIPTKTLKNGFSLPVIGFGTWRLGGLAERDPSNDDNRDIDAIRAAIEMGIRHIDTAELYAAGHTETLVAQALTDVPRKEITLASKVWLTNLKYESVKNSARRSLERLNTDYLDIYYIHARDLNVPLKETFKAINELVEEGLIKNVAVSNFSPESVKQSLALCSTPIIGDQVHYNLKFREPEKSGLLEMGRKEDFFTVAWRPTQYGEFAASGSNALIDKIAKKHDITPVQVALSWVTSQPGVITLVMTRSREHLKENIEGATFTLPDEDIELLRKEFPDQQDVSDRMPLL